MACCWVSRATLVVLKDHPLDQARSCWLWPGNLGRMWLGVVCGGGVLCENCIVDANAIIINGNGNNDYCCCCLFFFFVVFVLGIFCCLCVIFVFFV